MQFLCFHLPHFFYVLLLAFVSRKILIMQEQENIVDIVTSSLVAVMKQSLNASFRKECLHLLGVRILR